MDFSGLTVFIDGSYKRYEDVNIGLMNHSFLYGTACFEAVRAYVTDGEMNLRTLALREHLERLARSARILRMEIGHTIPELENAVLEVCRRNAFREDVYIRITLFKYAEHMGVGLDGIKDAVAIVAFPFPNGYYGAVTGLNVCVSPWRRVDDNAAPARAKITGIYVNSALAKADALAAGFDEAITLTDDGHVAEASAANLFLIRDKTLITPDVSQNILEGITRRIVLELSEQKLGLKAIERRIDRSELYTADEMFITGTAVGVTPILSVDGRAVNSACVGGKTATLRDVFENDVRREHPVLSRYLLPVYDDIRAIA